MISTNNGNERIENKWKKTSFRKGLFIASSSIILSTFGISSSAQTQTSTPAISTQTVSAQAEVSQIWQNVGPADFVTSPSAFVKLAVEDGTPYIVFKNNDGKISVMKYNSSDRAWHYVGPSSISRETVGLFDIETSNGDIYIAFDELSNERKISVMHYNSASNNWDYVGSRGFVQSSAHGLDLEIGKGRPYITTTIRTPDDRVQYIVKRFNRSNQNWETLGGTYGNQVFYPDLEFDGHNRPYIAYFEDNVVRDRIYVRRFNHSNQNWHSVTGAIYLGHFSSRFDMEINGEDIYIAGRDNVKLWNHQSNAWEIVGADQNRRLLIDLEISQEKANIANIKGRAEKLQANSWQTLGQDDLRNGHQWRVIDLEIDKNSHKPFLAYSRRTSQNGQKIGVMSYGIPRITRPVMNPGGTISIPRSNRRRQSR